jgi:hypothetical protein
MLNGEAMLSPESYGLIRVYSAARRAAIDVCCVTRMRVTIILFALQQFLDFCHAFVRTLRGARHCFGQTMPTRGNGAPYIGRYYPQLHNPVVLMLNHCSTR